MLDIQLVIQKIHALGSIEVTCTTAAQSRLYLHAAASASLIFHSSMEPTGNKPTTNSIEKLTDALEVTSSAQFQWKAFV